MPQWSTGVPLATLGATCLVQDGRQHLVCDTTGRVRGLATDFVISKLFERDGREAHGQDRRWKAAREIEDVGSSAKAGNQALIGVAMEEEALAELSSAGSRRPRGVGRRTRRAVVKDATLMHFARNYVVRPLFGS